MSTKIWEPTCYLRFVKKKKKDGTPRFILQQKWEKVDDDDRVFEEKWEEVPLVTAEPRAVVIELNDKLTVE